MRNFVTSRQMFVLLFLAAYGLSYIPVLHVPFKWLEVFFHEISHGLVAILTGGRVVSIELRPDGSGLCYYQGGWRLLISFAGYAGAVAWGLLIYLSAKSLGRRSNIIAWALTIMIGVSTILWARDLTTILILVIMGGLLFILAKFSLGIWITSLTQFIGIYVMQSALQSPTYLLDGQASGDGAVLASITFIPELIWVIIWIGIALLGFWYAWNHRGR